MGTVTGIAPGAIGVIQHERQAVSEPVHGLHVAAVFSDHMVLQRQAPIPVFGSAPAGTRVIVSLVNEQGAIVAETMTVARSQMADSTERNPWLALLPAFGAGGPYCMRVSCETEQIEFHDVMIGEVWLAGGQSNMEFELYASDGGKQTVENAHDPFLRFYNTPKTGQIDRQAEAQSSWEQAVAPQVAHMSAVAYYYARTLREQLGNDIAVGIIDCYIGGTSITCWMSNDTLAGSPAGLEYVQRYHDAIAGKTDEQMREEADTWQRTFDQWNADVAALREARPGITQPHIDAQLGPCPWPPPVTPFSERRISAPFEAMIKRVAPYGVKGFLWYQGSEDAPYAEHYRELLGLLIDEWRTLWNITAYSEPTVGYQALQGGTLPFLIVQLPQWIDGQVAARGQDPMEWPVIRAAQFDASESIDDVELICTMDCGEFDNIHPTDKRTIGVRLARLALRSVYGHEDIAAESPRITGICGSGGDGTLTVEVANARGLHWQGITPDTMRGCEPDTSANREAGASGFEVAGENGEFVPANAHIVGMQSGATDVSTSDDARDGSARDLAQVQVWAKSVPEPVHVRYAWRSWGPAPLFNEANLPALPFAG